MILGCIADDLTGATDLGLMLARGGLRVVQLVGVPAEPVPDADAVVVALKSRTINSSEAVAQALESAEALLRAGARQFFFKYCSTFDSTDEGNIGPVAEALLDRLGGGLTLACPAFPTNRRTVYLGHLFVGDELLSDSPMKDHPLTPMRDSNLVRVLQHQTRLPVGLVPFSIVDAGSDAIAAEFQAAENAGRRIVIVDAVTDRHLVEIGRAARDMRLITGGSGVALGLPDNYREMGLTGGFAQSRPLKAAPGRAAILSGSCSAATLGQVEYAKAAGMPSLRLDPLDLVAGRQSIEQALEWAERQPAGGPILIYSSADSGRVRQAQSALGRERAAAVVEAAMAGIARGLVEAGFSRLLVAGGETSGAVVEALGITALTIGPEIDPGVPWTQSLSGSRLCLALKSGNFGAADFFLKAWAVLR